MRNHLAALLIAIMVCMLSSVSVSAQDTAYIDIAEDPQYSIEVLCDLDYSVGLQVEVSYRGEKPSVAFIKPDGSLCEINRMHWSFTDSHISISISNADVGCWYVKTLAEDRDRLQITCQGQEVHTGAMSSVIRGAVIVLLLLVLLLLIFIQIRVRQNIH